jgi:hypothetical protein
LLVSFSPYLEIIQPRLPESCKSPCQQHYLRNIQNFANRKRSRSFSPPAHIAACLQEDNIWVLAINDICHSIPIGVNEKNAFGVIVPFHAMHYFKYLASCQSYWLEIIKKICHRCAGYSKHCNIAKDKATVLALKYLSDQTKVGGCVAGALVPCCSFAKAN